MTLHVCRGTKRISKIHLFMTRPGMLENLLSKSRLYL
nr:MAG TPA: hypothetical protein [Caudoviricetes sp.]